jgi:hypothetical protein
VQPLPLEVMSGEAAPRRILEQEWWLAALQEPLAEFKSFEGDDWPTSEAAWCAREQNEALFLDFDLRIRRAFFAQSRNIVLGGSVLATLSLVSGRTCGAPALGR